MTHFSFFNVIIKYTKNYIRNVKSFGFNKHKDKLWTCWELCEFNNYSIGSVNADSHLDINHFFIAIIKRSAVDRIARKRTIYYHLLDKIKLLLKWFFFARYSANVLKPGFYINKSKCFVKVCLCIVVHPLNIFALSKNNL